MRFREFLEPDTYPSLGLPVVTRRSVIRFLDTKSNPILVHLDDGTRLYIPFDAFRKVRKEPQVGRTLTVVFQRREGDKSIVPSQIHSCECED